MVKYALSFDTLLSKPIRSKTKWNGNYKEELAKIMDILEEAFETASGNHFEVDSAMVGTNNIRVRVSDPELGARMIVNCVFWYHHDDERYGYISIDLVASGLSKKPKLHFVGKFKVTDRAKIKERVWRDFVACVKF